MKRVVYGIILFLAFIFPINVKAEGTSTYYIEANILENGDMFVKELKILDGSYNGIKTNLRYKNMKLQNFTGVLENFEGSDIYNASNLVDVKVYDVINDQNTFEIINTPNIQFEKVNYASKGDYGVYTETRISNGVDLLIYMPSSYKRASLVTYTLKDVAVVHNDIAEIAWDFISEDYEENISNLVIRVNLPNDSNELRVFSHGPLNGVNKIINRNTVELVYNHLSKGNAVDMRVVFDKELVQTATKKSNINGLEYILEVEKERADDANSKREEAYKGLEEIAKNNVEYAKTTMEKEDYVLALYAVEKLKDSNLKQELLNELNILKTKIEEKDKKNQNTIYLLSGIWFVGLIILIIVIYNKFDKEHSGEFNGEYYREIPNNYSPGIVSYLIYKDVKKDVFAASVMEFIRKDILLVEELKIEKTGFLKTKTIKDYKFTKNPDFNTETLSKSDQKLLYLLIELVGNGKEVTLNQIKEYSNDPDDASLFAQIYSSWQSLVLSEATRKKFFEDNVGVKICSILYSLLPIVILCISISMNVNHTIIFILFIPALASIIYFSLYTRVKKKHVDEYRKWNGLKNYLEDFGNFADKEVLQINLWESYLVYATVFGIADKLQETMKVNVQNMSNIDDSILLDMDNWHFNRALSNSLNKSVNSAKRTVRTLETISNIEDTLNIIGTIADVALSSSSSSGGFGGGSSTRIGGGFGGGGSSGGRF